eukprot:678744-Pelagomonas_calceolata.AAC.1
MKTEHTPTGWNWPKLRPEHAPPNTPTGNPPSGANTRNRPVHTDSRTYSNPLFETQDMELENPLFQSQDNPPPDNQTRTEAQETQERRTRKRHNSRIDVSPTPEQGTPPTQGLSTPSTQALSLDPTQTPLAGGRRSRGSQAPKTLLEYHTQPILTPCPLPLNAPGTDVAQWLWNYKQNKAA